VKIAGGTTAITTQGGNTVININIGSSGSSSTPKTLAKNVKRT